MRGLAKSAVAMVGVAAIVLTGCGVAAPRNVASIDGIGVTMDDIDSTARDPLYQLLSEDADEYAMPGDAARQALVANVVRAVWVAEARRWGLDTSSRRSDGEKALDDQLAAMAEPPKMSERTRDRFIDLFAAQVALQDRFQKLDPTSEDDLRKIYDLSPMLWDRTCAFILVVPEGSDAEVRRLMERGVGVQKISERVEGTQVVTTPDDGCMSQGSIPAQIRDDLRMVPIGGADLFSVDAGGVTQTFMVEVVSREKVSFEDARKDLAGIAAALLQGGPQEWVNLRLVETRVDPRFGSGITVDGQGQPYVVPPAGPLRPGPAFAGLDQGPING